MTIIRGNGEGQPPTPAINLAKLLGVLVNLPGILVNLSRGLVNLPGVLVNLPGVPCQLTGGTCQLTGDPFGAVSGLSWQAKTAQNAVGVFKIELCKGLGLFWRCGASLWSIARALEFNLGTSWRPRAHRIGFSLQCCIKWAGKISEKPWRVVQNRAFEN